MNSRRRRAIRLLAFSAVSILGVSYASNAGYLDVESTPNSTFTAGTLDLTASPAFKAWEVGNMAPGDVEYRTISMGNAGTLPLTYDASTTLISQRDGEAVTNAPTGPNAGLGEVLRLSYRGPVGSAAECSAAAPVLSTTAGFTVGTTTPIPLGQPVRRLEPGASEELCFAFELPREAGNVYQGDSALFDLFFNAGQTTRGATDGDGSTESNGDLALIFVDGVPGDTRVDLSWAPMLGAASYTVTALDAAGASVGPKRSTTALAMDFIDLRNGEPYSFRVIALDTDGKAIASGVGGPFVPNDGSLKPVATSALNVVAGDRTLDASWGAFSSSQLCPVTRYIVGASPDATLARDRVLPADRLGVFFSGLDPKIASVVTLRAASACGISEPLTSESLFPALRPNAPTNVSLVESLDGGVQLSWAAPTGSTPALTYRVSATPEGGGAAVVSETASTNPKVEGLDNTKRYVFVVEALNKAGDSAPTTAVGPFPAATKPWRLVVLDAKATPTGATLNWNEGRPPRGITPASSYSVVVSDDLGAVTLRREVSARSLDVGDLDPARRYRATVTALNIAGPGPSTTSGQFTVLSAPGAVTGLSAAALPGGLRLDWTLGAVTDEPEAHRVVATSASGKRTEVIVTGAARSAAVTGLDFEAPYTVTVTAYNAAGSGAPASATSTTGPPVDDLRAPSVPGDLKTLEAPDGQLSLSWDLDARTQPVDDWSIAVIGDGTIRRTTSASTSVVVKDLDPSTSYRVEVVARNRAGSSDPAVLEDARATVVASEVRSLSATSGDGEVRLTWAAPARTGSGVTGYLVRYDGQEKSVASGTTELVLTGLDRSRPMTFEVIALGRYALGESASIEAVPALVPSAVRSLTSVSGEQMVALAWTPGTDGSPATSYDLRWPGEGSTARTSTVSSPSAVLTGLTNGRSYTVEVTPRNAAGAGETSIVVVVPIADSAPPAVLDLSSAVRDGATTLSWTPGSLESDVDFAVVVTTSAGTPVSSASTREKSLTLNGLDTGTTYLATVTPTGARGAGEPSSITFVPAATAGSVLNLASISAVEGSLTTTWDAPAKGTTSSYEVVLTTAAGEVRRTSTTSTVLVLNGLAPTQAHQVTVVAIGPGGRSGPSSVVAYPTVPAGAPADLVGTPGAGAVDLAWSAPNTGGPVVRYEVLMPDTRGELAVVRTLDAASRSVTVRNLDPEEPFVGRVRAMSLGGGAFASTEVLRPAVIPGAPVAVTTSVPKSGSATVRWAAPETGTRVARYELSWEGGSASAVGTTTMISGLDPARSYTFAITPINAAGTGPSAASAPMYPAVVPTAVTRLSAISEVDGEMTVAWTPGDTKFSSPALTYEVRADPSSGAPTTVVATAPVTTAALKGLDSSKAYALTVTPSNAAGAGPSTSLAGVYPATVPGPVRDVAGIEDDGRVVLSWKAPIGGTPASGYRVSVSSAADSGGSVRTTMGTSLVFNGLTNGREYVFTVVATNVAGAGPGVEAGPFVPTKDPGKATDLKAAPSGTTVRLTWVAPTAGAPVVSYTVSGSPAAGSLTNPVTTGETSLNITGLTLDQTYDFTVVANSSGGASAPVVVRTKSVSNPVAPTSVQLTSPAVGALDTTWVPASTGSAVEGYRVVLTSWDRRVISDVVVGADQAFHSFADVPYDVVDGHWYQISVSSFNAAGQSAGRISAQVYPYPAPAAPTGVKATKTAPGSLTVSLDPVTSYGARSLLVKLPGQADKVVDLPATSTTFTGLDQNVLHSATVSVVSFAGLSASVSTEPISVGYAPGQPTGLSVSGISGGALLSWTAPPSGPTASLATSYRVTATAGTKVVTTTTSLPRTYLTGLENGVAYAIEVMGVSSVGAGEPATATVVPRADSGRYTSTVLADSPIGYWPFDGPNRSELTGRSAIASNSSLNTGPALTANTVNGASNANQSSSRPAVPLSDDLVNGSFAFETWTGNNGGLYTTGSLPIKIFSLSGGATIAGTTIPLTVPPSSASRYLVVTRDAGTGVASVYVDGVLAGSAVTATPNVKYSLGTAILDVQIAADEVAVYDKALTPQQITTHYQAGLFAPGVPASLATTVNNAAGSIAAAWAVPAAKNTTGGPSSYVVELRNGAGAVVSQRTLNVSTTSTSWTGLAPSSYTVAVVAANAAGTSAAATAAARLT